MANLSDHIEEYLKKLLDLTTRSYIDIQRHELAGKFGCVPSQINYVLASRFSPERGYLVESRRGGGGYIRIFCLQPMQLRSWEGLLDEISSDDFEPLRALHLIKRGCEEHILSRREGRIICSLLNEELFAEAGCSKKMVRLLQKRLLKAALEAILKESY